MDHQHRNIMPGNETPRPTGRSRWRPPIDKIRAIDQVHSGKSKAAVARSIGVPESTLRGWCKAEDKIRSQLNTTGTYEHRLITSSSDNSPDNSRPGSSSHLTQTAQNSIIPNPGATDRLNEESESSPAPKRAKPTENNLSTAITTGSVNNMSTAICASVGNDQALNAYILNVLRYPKTMAYLNFLNGFPYFSYPGYGSDASIFGENAANLLLHRNNGAMANMTMPSTMSTSNVLINGSKRKYSAPTPTTTPDIQTRVSSRKQHNQSPLAQKSSENLLQSTNNQTSFIPSTSTNNSHVGAAVSSKSSKKLNAIIRQLQQQQGIAPVCNAGDETVSNAVTNNNSNNVHHVNNETKNLKLTNSLPLGFENARSSCRYLHEWLETSGTPKFTFQQIKNVRIILENLDDWANSVEFQSKKKTNGTS